MAKQCRVEVKVYFADPGSRSGYGTVTGTIPCGQIDWNAERPPAGFRPKLSDVYQVKVGVCRNGTCQHTDLDLDVRGGTFRRRRK